jgi:hypothetical protein
VNGHQIGHDRLEPLLALYEWLLAKVLPLPFYQQDIKMMEKEE